MKICNFHSYRTNLRHKEVMNNNIVEGTVISIPLKIALEIISLKSSTHDLVHSKDLILVHIDKRKVEMETIPEKLVQESECAIPSRVRNMTNE